MTEPPLPPPSCTWRKADCGPHQGEADFLAVHIPGEEAASATACAYSRGRLCHGGRGPLNAQGSAAWGPGGPASRDALPFEQMCSDEVSTRSRGRTGLRASATPALIPSAPGLQSQLVLKFPEAAADPSRSSRSALLSHSPARGGGAGGPATGPVTPERPCPHPGQAPLAPWHNSRETTEETPVLSPHLCSLPSSGAPSKTR